MLYDASPSDAGDIARLLYHTYGHSYANPDMYDPDRIELAFRRDQKFAVIARTRGGTAAGHFAVIRAPDASIGEVAEVMVLPRHRRRGLMTRMLGRLVERARAERMRALYGEAVSVHAISQRVNHRHGFRSTALILGAFPITRYRRLVESFPEDLSAIVEFLMLDEAPVHAVYMPSPYRGLLHRIYAALGILVEELNTPRYNPAPTTRLEVRIAYHNLSAVIVVRRFGRDFENSVLGAAVKLRDRNISAIYVDMPMGSPCIEKAVEVLARHGYVFSGLMPLCHGECDTLRMQSIATDLDLDLIVTYSPLAAQIKRRVRSELQTAVRTP